ncbi:MAG: hypothetical protein R3C49_04250 [Planctomycetaceae bacterium]
MKVRRRLTFQLTPLLDLLLIVIFAQYMEVRQNAESGAADLQKQRNAMVEELERQRDQLTAVREKYSQHYQSILQQHQQAGQTLADTFNLPGRIMEEILRLRTDGREIDAEHLQTAAEHLKELLPERGTEFLDFMLKYDEMQKHVSVWELHIQENGQALFSDGQQDHTISFGTEDEFVTRSFETSKAFAEPRLLVIILLSHADAQAGQVRRATDGMPPLVEQLRRDSGNARWFDFSLMGFRPSGALLHTPPSR